MFYFSVSKLISLTVKIVRWQKNEKLTKVGLDTKDTLSNVLFTKDSTVSLGLPYSIFARTRFLIIIKVLFLDFWQHFTTDTFIITLSPRETKGTTFLFLMDWCTSIYSTFWQQMISDNHWKLNNAQSLLTRKVSFARIEFIFNHNLNLKPWNSDG
jgi:hypothetical protein